MNQPATTMNMRSQTGGFQLPSELTTLSQFCNTLLPRAIRDLKGQSEQTVFHSANPGLTPTANTI